MTDSERDSGIEDVRSGGAPTEDARDIEVSKPPPDSDVTELGPPSLGPDAGVLAQRLESTVGGFEERYELGERIARGGMGEVLLCDDLALRRPVALKRLRSKRRRRGRIERFVREAQITAQLEHPSIVPVHELGLVGGDPYFTMKRVEGQTLESLIRELRAGGAEAQAATPIPKRIRMMLQVCQAVSFAHSRGVIHRDLKPANIMVGSFGEVLVMDWGLAKEIGSKEAEPEGDASDSWSSGSVSTEALEPGLQTRAGQVVGTPMYMSPEQARGEVVDLDARSDVYGLGAVLLALLALRAPIGERGAQAVLRQVRRGELDLPGDCEGDPPTPVELQAIVAKATAFEKEQRYPDVAALIADLEAWLNDAAVSAHQDSLSRMFWKWARRNRSSAVGLAAASLAALLALFGARLWQEQALAEQVAARLSAGREALAARRFEPAKEAFVQVLGLAPSSQAGREGYQAAVLGAEQAEREARATEAQEALQQALAATQMPESALAGELGRRRWYEAHSEALTRARTLRRLPAGEAEGRLRVQELARALGRRLAGDRNFVMAEMFLREASEAGLPEESVRAERAYIDSLKTERERRIVARAQSILESTEGLLRLEEGRYQERLQALVAEPHPELTRCLIGAIYGSPGGTFVFGDAPRNVTLRLIFEALEALRDFETEVMVPAEAVRQPLSEVVWPLNHRDLYRGEVARRVPEEAQRLSLRAADAASLVLLEWIAWSAPSPARWGCEPEVALAAARVLAASGDPDGGRVLSEARWAMGEETSFWVRTAALLRRLPAPPDAPPASPAEALSRGRWLVGLERIPAALASFEAAEGPAATFGQAVCLRRLGRLGEAQARLEELIGGDLQASQALLERARCELAGGQPERALKSVHCVIADQGQPFWHHLRGRILEALGRIPEALAAYAEAVAADGADVASLERQAELLASQGATAAALGSWSAALRIAPKSLASRLARGRAWLKLGAWPLALDDFDAALTLDPDAAGALRGRAEVLWRYGYHGDRRRYGERCGLAQRDLDRAIAGGEEDWELRIEQARLTLERARADLRLRPRLPLERAEAELNAALAEREDPEPLRLLAEVYRRMPAPSRLAETLDRLEGAGELRQARLWRAELLRDERCYEGARGQLSALAEAQGWDREMLDARLAIARHSGALAEELGWIDGRAWPAPLRAYIGCLRGELLLDLERPADAAAAAEAVLAEDPSLARAHILKGRLALAREDREQARASALEALGREAEDGILRTRALAIFVRASQTE